MATGECWATSSSSPRGATGPFKAADFNFWGVTFARDSNVFYATL